jgi:predicted NBD/HSP70 family sugar kinase
MPPNQAGLTPLRRGDIPRTADCRQTSSAAAVLRAALDHGPVARSSVARLASLSPAAVSRLSTRLTRAGLLRDAPEASGPKGVGRPHVPVDVDTSRLVACGLHIAAQRATLSLLDLRGQVVARESIAHADTRPEQLLSPLARRVPAFIGEHASGRTPLGLGVATGGWVDAADGRIVEQPVLGWRNVPVSEILGAATGLPVFVDNHSRALARAERTFGDVRARTSIVHLLVGNVVDAAFATGDTVHHGPHSAAGAVAHLPLPGRCDPCPCGRRGCLQAVVSSQALARRAEQTGIGGGFAGLLDAALAGDERALSIFRDRARLVGAGAAVLLDLLNPDLLVVAEAATTLLPDCLELLRDEVRAHSAMAEDPGRAVVSTSFALDALPVAGAAVILDEVYANPLRASAHRRRPSLAASGSAELFSEVAKLTLAPRATEDGVKFL